MGTERKGKCKRHPKLRNYWINITDKTMRFGELKRGKNQMPKNAYFIKT